LYYIPQCSVQHKRRATLRSHLKQVYISGRGRGELMRRSGLTGQLLYLGPAALLAWLVMTPFVFWRFPIAVVPLIAYAVLALALSGVTFARRQQPIFLLAGPLMLLSHLVYGGGLLKGLAASRAYEGKALSMEVVEFSAREDVGDRRDRDLVGRDVQLERADDLIVRQEIG
jgi:hypothetical protein